MAKLKKNGSSDADSLLGWMASWFRGFMIHLCGVFVFPRAVDPVFPDPPPPPPPSAAPPPLHHHVSVMEDMQDIVSHAAHKNARRQMHRQPPFPSEFLTVCTKLNDTSVNRLCRASASILTGQKQRLNASILNRPDSPRRPAAGETLIEPGETHLSNCRKPFGFCPVRKQMLKTWAGFNQSSYMYPAQSTAPAGRHGRLELAIRCSRGAGQRRFSLPLRLGEGSAEAFWPTRPRFAALTTSLAAFNARSVKWTRLTRCLAVAMEGTSKKLVKVPRAGPQPPGEEGDMDKEEEEFSSFPSMSSLPHGPNPTMREFEFPATWTVA
ncbi:hypothetical protein B0T19DRAFT_21615 [Cercophora scortea]|uniref:Uncharacterized protein n=1 Tax=Cercophora scortea TaxID=314031 RepID=A0AAE0J2T6_9PEZI|nr:hypothetical protein B0T19DRAFT_21615 [Cercophora scortea]